MGILSHKKVSETGGWIILSPASHAGVYLTAGLLVHTPATTLGSLERSKKSFCSFSKEDHIFS